MSKIKLLELFAGIGAFSKSLKNLNIPYELVAFSEIDKYATKSYCVIHGVNESLNLGDITKIDERKLPDFDLLTYGFPCQDISVAGKQKGIELGTRSGLLYEALRIIQYKMPKYCIAENVKNLVGKKFKDKFKELIAELEFYGYNSYFKVLNAKDYGIPQNRERIFIISIRKDIDKKDFEWPKPFDNGLRLKDLLESEVDEKYYISQDKTDKLIQQLKDEKVYSAPLKFLDRNCVDTCNTLIAAGPSRGLDNNNPITGIMYVGNVNPSGKGMNGGVWSDEGLSPTLTTNKGEGNKILQVGMLDIKGNEQIRRVYNPEGCSPTLNTCEGGNRQPKILQEYRIRKLTPKECFRLQGFSDEDFGKASVACSNSQLYKQAGNSICVPVLEAFMKILFKDYIKEGDLN